MRTRQILEDYKRLTAADSAVDAAEIIRNTPAHSGITQADVDQARAAGQEAIARGYERVIKYRNQSSG